MAAQQGSTLSGCDKNVPNFHNYKVSDLKTYLQQRGITCSDHRKNVLIELCEKSESLGLKVVKTPDSYLKSSADRQTVSVNGKNVHFGGVGNIKPEKWCDDLKHVPDVEWPHVIVYLMDKCGWTPNQIATYKETRGFSLNNSGHIHKVQTHKIKDYEYFYIRADCTRQTSQSEKPYILWILIHSSCKIYSAGCQCTG